MDDPALAWPAWKFGMRTSDLSTTLHDQYNTITLTLQDPEAFHHDVYEISCKADTTEEFHRFMADRRRQRITELQESYESLAVEIIANPKLIGSNQWQHALQLFRTKSYDSIIRYFASYLPDGYLDRHHGHETSSSTASSFSETDSIHTVSTKASSADDANSTTSAFLDDFFPHGPVMTAEPCTIEPSQHRPLSPVSDVLRSESADSSSYASSTNPPSRSMSFSGSESGTSGFLAQSLIPDDDETSQSDASDTAVTSVCDSVELRSPYDSADKVPCKSLPIRILHAEEADDDDDIPTAQFPEDDFCVLANPFDTYETITSDSCDTPLDSDTPTPRAAFESSSCYVDIKSALSRSTSLRTPRPRSGALMKSRSLRKVEGSPVREAWRSPEEALCKVQKPMPDPTRKRPKGRRWLD